MKRHPVKRSEKEQWLHELVEQMVRCGACGIRIEVAVQKDGRLVTVGVCSSGGKMNDEQVARRALGVLADAWGVPGEKEEQVQP